METLPKIKSERRNLRSLQVSTDTKTEKYREGHWNNRFHMAHMKEFKDNIKLTLLDKLAVLDSSIKRSQRIFNRSAFKQPLTNQRISVSHYSSSSEDEEKKSNEPTLFQMKINLKKVWEEKRVPECHRVAFMKAMDFCKIKRARKQITKEIASITKKHNPLQTLKKSVNARENCLKKLMDALQVRGGVNYDKLDNNIQLILRDYLELTIFTIQNILKWRGQLQRKLRRDKIHKYSVPFEYNGQNYMLKIIEDQLKISKKLIVKEEDVLMVELNLTPLTKTRACEVVLLQEQLQCMPAQNLMQQSQYLTQRSHRTLPTQNSRIL